METETDHALEAAAVADEISPARPAEPDTVMEPDGSTEPESAPEPESMTEPESVADPESVAAPESVREPRPARLVPLPSQMGRGRQTDPSPASTGATNPATGSGQTTAVASASDAAVTAAMAFGRYDSEGNVFVTLPNGNEWCVGQWTAGDPSEGLRFYAVRYNDLVVDVDLAGHRITEGRMSPDDGERTIERVRAALLDPKVVGDLGALAERVHQLELLVKIRRDFLAEERDRIKSEAAARRTELVAEAETLATSHNWRKAADRFRAIVEEWKTIPRFDRDTEQELWVRLSAARSAFDKARRQHHTEVEKAQAAGKAAKEKLIAEAEAIAASTDWIAGANAYRDLMEKWKKAGFAGKPADDALWKRFRAAQDTFFAARKAALSQRDAEWSTNLAAKRAVVAKAEALLPITDVKTARRKFRTLASEFAAIGHVPRADKPKLDARMSKVEEAIKASEHDQWRKSDPEKSARASAIVALYEKSVADLEAKLAKVSAAGGDTSAVKADLKAQRELLAAARKYA